MRYLWWSYGAAVVAMAVTFIVEIIVARRLGLL